MPAYVSALRPVLILRDNRLADSFGTKLCLQLKNDASTRHIPVVLVSAANQLAQVAAEAARMLT
ncbi:MAG: hypothetical protein EOP49_54260 [Sphingobacteriales bacterium]|nr:MAG: hypothetical protein EOP49_54260 [Sphingobacteriales bacterium]